MQSTASIKKDGSFHHSNFMNLSIFTEQNKKIIWIVIFLGTLTWSGIDPTDQFTWFLEVLPAIIGVIALALTYRYFQFTTMVYCLILLHTIILMIGGHYTYAEVPWFSNLFGFERNNYDKVGHFFQGFVPALIIREVFIQEKIIRGKAWLNVLTVSFCLAISAFYELIEWFTAFMVGQDADAFLGTQGYDWDTQSDMAIALLGAVLALVLLSKVHDAQIMKKMK